MPTSADKRRDIALFIDWLHGQEAQGDAAGAVARFVQTHARTRPTQGKVEHSPFKDIDHLKTVSRFHGPNVPEENIDTAFAAFLAS